MHSTTVLSHEERIKRLLSGEDTDRPPFAFWTHFPNRDRHPRRLAEMSLDHQATYGYDFLKFTPYGQYSVADWGADVALQAGFSELPTVAEPVIRSAESWRELERVSGVEGEYAIVLEAQRFAISRKAEGLPFLQTIFSPLTTAMKLSSEELIVSQLREDSAAVHRGLEVILETTLEFMKAVFAGGADGIFLAGQLSRSGLLSDEEHREFVEDYDRVLLAEADRRGWFNVTHIHGNGERAEVFSEMPLHGISWHDVDDGPLIRDSVDLGGKVALGGLSWWPHWNEKSIEELDTDLAHFFDPLRTTPAILTPGCIFGPETEHAGLQHVANKILGSR